MLTRQSLLLFSTGLLLSALAGLSNAADVFTEVLSFSPKRSVDPHFALSPDGTWWAFFRKHGEVEIRSLPDDKLQASVPVIGFGAVLCVSGDSQTLAVTTNGREGEKLGEPRTARTHFFSRADWKQSAVIDHGDLNLSIKGATALSPDGKLFAGASHSIVVPGRFRLWEVATQKQLADREHGARDWHFVEFSADGSKLLVVGMPPEVIDIPSSKTRKLEGVAPPRSVSFAPDGKSAVFGVGMGELQFATVATGKAAPAKKYFTRDVTALRFVNGGQHLLVGAAYPDHELRLYDAKAKLVASVRVPDNLTIIEFDATFDGSLAAAKALGMTSKMFIWRTPLAAK
jgi:WD40 repeat protein